MARILYTTPNCKYCPGIKRDLAIAGLEYEERNALEHRQELADLAIHTVPTLVVDNSVYLGDDIKKYIHGHV